MDIDPLYAEIGRRIVALRKAAGITQGTLAGAVGLGRTSITNMERGRQSIPLHTLYRMAEALGVSIHDLIPSEGEKT